MDLKVYQGDTVNNKLPPYLITLMVRAQKGAVRACPRETSFDPEIREGFSRMNSSDCVCRKPTVPWVGGLLVRLLNPTSSQDQWTVW